MARAPICQYLLCTTLIYGSQPGPNGEKPSSMSRMVILAVKVLKTIPSVIRLMFNMDLDPQFGFGAFFFLLFFFSFFLSQKQQYLADSNSFGLRHPHLEGTFVFTSLRVMFGHTAYSS